MSEAQPELSIADGGRRKRSIPMYVWILCSLCAVWLCLAFYGELLRERNSSRADVAPEGSQLYGPADPEAPAVSDAERPVEVLPPVNAAADRGREYLHLSAHRCGKLHQSFQAKVAANGLCEVYLHDLARQDNAVLIMASPKYGVQANGRPIIVMLPESVYPER